VSDGHDAIAAKFGEGILKRCSSGFKRITLPPGGWFQCIAEFEFGHRFNFLGEQASMANRFPLLFSWRIQRENLLAEWQAWERAMPSSIISWEYGLELSRKRFDVGIGKQLQHEVSIAAIEAGLEDCHCAFVPT
jgi:hypothetical protein